MKAIIFANPISGQGEGVAMAAAIANHLVQKKWDVQTILEHPDTLQDQLFTDDSDALIVIGGDGTLRSVLHRATKTRTDLPPTLFVPLGTANLMSQHLKLQWKGSYVDQVWEMLQNRRIREVDAAECNGGLFLLMTTVGIDAAVVHDLGRTRKGPITKGSYLQPALSALWNFKQPEMTVEVDGIRVVEKKRVFTFIANVREYGAGFPIANEAVSDDGQLDICIFPADSQLNLLQMSIASLVTLPTFFPGSMYLRGKTVRVISEEPAPVQIDGDAGGFTPIDIRLLPFRVRFIVQ